MRDIKDIVVVHEHSLEILLLVVVTTILLIAVAFYLFKNRRKRRKKLTPKEMAYKRLKSIDFSDTKDSIYTFCEDGSLFVDEKNQSSFKELEKELQKYKYKREIPNLDEVIVSKMREFIGGIK